MKRIFKINLNDEGKLLHVCLLTIGAIIVIGGVIFNPSIVSKYLSQDGILGESTVTKIYILEAFVITLGFCVCLYTLVEKWTLSFTLFAITYIAILGHIILLYTKPLPLIDEKAHFGQIEMYLEGVFEHHTRVTNLPGYHIVIALTCYLFNLSTLADARLISLLIGLTSVFVFYRCALKIIPERVHQRTLDYFLLPIFFPYLFLVYPISLSMLLILLGINSFLNTRRFLAALFLGVSVLVIQTNIIWVCMFFMMIYANENNSQVSLDKIKHHIKNNFSFVMIIFAFVLFVFLNDGVALGDEKRHSITLRTENIFFSLFVFFVLFLPFILYNIRSIAMTVKERYLSLTLICFTSGAIYLYFFNVVHPYNLHTNITYLHNIVPNYFAQNIYTKLFSLPPIILAMLAISVFYLNHKSQYLLYPFWILSLLSLSLIEHRYYIPMMTMFLLFKQPEREMVEWTLTLYFLVLSFGVSLWIYYGNFP